MSAEAVSHVWKYAASTGPKLLVLLAIAHSAKERFDPFTAEISYPALAKKVRVHVRVVKTTVRQLIESGELEIQALGGGRKSNVYLLTIRYGKAGNRAVLKSCRLDVMPTAPLVRESA